MNHFDDRASHIAYLREQGQIRAILDNNLQQDVSMCAFGPSIVYSPGQGLRALAFVSDMQQPV